MLKYGYMASQRPKLTNLRKSPISKHSKIYNFFFIIPDLLFYFTY